ncbi:hypothetical protein AB1Y20_009572 [Prymnesium parvum]|uniref:Calmodulin-lysine N-methyltransferase n=1 Tax=Prymnesium parvum TaxID=97485 RepID=A0AB34K173_PRYPA
MALALLMFAPGVSPSPFFEFGGHQIHLEQRFHEAEEGSVVWDASRSLLAFVMRHTGTGADLVQGKHILEIGAGTGAVGLTLARLGAKSVVMCDKASQLPLIKRNAALNRPDGCMPSDDSSSVEVVPLHWQKTWQVESPALATPNKFDLLICCDCVYPDRPSYLAYVLRDLLALNPAATLLLSCEHRAATCTAPPGTDHIRDFFAAMRLTCEVIRITQEELDSKWQCEDISVWKIRYRG